MEVAELKQRLAPIIADVKKASFVEEYQAKANDAETLGLTLAHYFEWSPLEIIEACHEALEDANLHKLSAELMEEAKNGGWMEGGRWSYHDQAVQILRKTRSEMDGQREDSE